MIALDNAISRYLSSTTDLFEYLHHTVESQGHEALTPSPSLVVLLADAVATFP